MFDEKRCILVVDDDKKIVRGISDLLKASGYEVLTANDGEEAFDCHYENSTKIDLILLDVMMPKVDGYEVLEELRNQQCFVPIILLTAKSEEYDQLKGFKLGADDYIPKPFSPSLLLARIEAVLKRLGKNSDSEILLGELECNLGKRQCKLSGKILELTKREFDLLHFFLLNNGIIFSRDQILIQVWGYDFEGDSRTVDTHIKQLRTKLGEFSTYIKTIHRVGYKFEVELDENED